MKRFLIAILLSLYAVCNVIAETISNVYTPNGSNIQVIIANDAEELTEFQSANCITTIHENYPNVVILNRPTVKYNCHGYAWHITQGGDTCWINYSRSNKESNLSQYWTDGSFIETTSDKASIIFYDDGDHSAIVSATAGKYISKWGMSALVQHEPDDCPYWVSTSTLRYYTRPNCKYGALSVFYMSDYIPLNTNVSFSNSTFTRSDFTYEWIVENAKGENAVEKGFATISKNKNNATISFSKNGIYPIYLRVYDYTDYMVGEFSYEAIVGEYNFLNVEKPQLDNDSIQVINNDTKIINSLK